MKTTVRRLPAAPIGLAAALLTAFLVLFAPLSASAHDSLIASSPEADGTVETLPTELTLTFSAKLIDGEGATEIVVTDPAGDSVIDGAPTLNGAVVTQPLASEAPAGAYHVVWKVVSSDGHPTSGEFDFTVTTGTESIATAEPTASPTTAEPTPAATAGPGTDVTSAPEESDSSPATTMIWILASAGALVIVGIVVWLVIRGRRSPGSTDSDVPTER